MTVSQRDVALRAGVSVRTVSNVVNDFPLVARSTRQRVQRAIDELGYRPNVSAQNLRRGTSGLIGVAVPELSVPYFSELAGLIVQNARRRHYTVVVEQTDGDHKRERELLSESGRSQLLDGLIFSPLALDQEDVRSHPSKLPVVFLGEHTGDGPYDHIGIDNVAAAREATAHLARLGRQRIAAIGHQGGSLGETGKLRTAGYRQALRDNGLHFRKELLIPARSFHRDSGGSAMEELLTLPQPPDAVFCYNDLLAIGALRVALTRGLKVPDDIAIVGFDDIEEGRYCVPSLTTVSPDKEEIARAAVDHLFARLKEPDRPFVSHVSHHQLVIRESSLGSAGTAGFG